MSDRRLTFSEIKSWKQCRFKHGLAYDRRLSAKSEAGFFRRGRFVHKYIDLMYTHIKPGNLSLAELDALLVKEWALVCAEPNMLAEDDDMKMELAVIRGMVLGYYHAFFESEAFDGIVTEQEVTAEFGDAKFAAKMDGIVKQDGKYWVHEIKTVGSFGDSEKKLLNVDEQITHYVLMAHEKYGRVFQGGIRTWIKTPSIKQTKKETVDEYCLRVVDDYVTRPDFYFGRIIVPRTEEQLEAHRQYIVKVYDEIVNCNNVFRCVTFSCGGCDFFDVCTELDPTVREAILDRDFKVRKQRHAELERISL